jgi:hypothetical protein
VQVLHDAFFKYQTKPKLSSHGDLYYEGKEFEVPFLCSLLDMAETEMSVFSTWLTELNAMHVCTQQVKLREMKPGMLSRELKEALGMPDGAPPPWLINMQVLFLVKENLHQLFFWLSALLLLANGQLTCSNFGRDMVLHPLILR